MHWGHLCFPNISYINIASLIFWEVYLLMQSTNIVDKKTRENLKYCNLCTSFSKAELQYYWIHLHFVSSCWIQIGVGGVTLFIFFGVTGGIFVIRCVMKIWIGSAGALMLCWYQFNMEWDYGKSFRYWSIFWWAERYSSNWKEIWFKIHMVAMFHRLDLIFDRSSFI